MNHNLTLTESGSEISFVVGYLRDSIFLLTKKKRTTSGGGSLSS